MSSILKNKLAARNARLMHVVDPDRLIEEADSKIECQELLANSSADDLSSSNKMLVCKLVELGYPCERQSEDVPEPPDLDDDDDFSFASDSPVTQMPLGRSPDLSPHHPPPSPEGNGLLASPSSPLRPHAVTPHSPLLPRDVMAPAGPEGAGERSAEPGESAREPSPVDRADASYRQAKSRLVAGDMQGAVDLLEQALASCPPGYPQAVDKIAKLLTKARAQAEADAGGGTNVEVADRAYRDAKAALIAGDPAGALELLESAYKLCPTEYRGARSKVEKLSKLVQSQLRWSDAQ